MSEEGIPSTSDESLGNVVAQSTSTSSVTGVSHSINHDHDDPEGDDKPLLSGGDDDMDPNDAESRLRFARAKAALTSGPTQKLTTFQFVTLSMYWFGWSFLWLPLLIVIIPMQVCCTPASAHPLVTSHERELCCRCHC
jgi:hypothetical protein